MHGFTTVKLQPFRHGNIARKRVDVEVFYRPIVAWGALTAERSVRLSTLIANRT